jgi:flagellar hook-length control protein FliK
MLERVESALKEAARTRDGKTISLKLEPVNLGQVKVDVSLRDGSLHARVTPQNKEVLTALREHSHELQGALRRLGLNVERVTVQVVGDSFQQSMQESKGFFDGKSFQGDRNNMPGQERQVPENRFGNEFADVSKAGIAEIETAKADHWIA